MAAAAVTAADINLICGFNGFALTGVVSLAKLSKAHSGMVKASSCVECHFTIHSSVVSTAVEVQVTRRCWLQRVAQVEIKADFPSRRLFSE